MSSTRKRSIARSTSATVPASTSSAKSDAQTSPKTSPPTYSWESVDAALAAGLEDLAAAHHAELEEDYPLLPNWPGYRLMERRGEYRAMLMRDDRNRLVGYISYFVQAPMCCTAQVWAMNDAIYIDPEHRKGTAGVRLLAEAEKGLAARGAVRFVYAGIPDSLAPLFKDHRKAGTVMMRGVG